MADSYATNMIAEKLFFKKLLNETSVMKKNALFKLMVLLFGLSFGAVLQASEASQMYAVEIFCQQKKDFLGGLILSQQTLLEQAIASLESGTLPRSDNKEVIYQLSELVAQFSSELVLLDDDSVLDEASPVIATFVQQLVKLETVVVEILKLCWKHHPACWPADRSTELVAGFETKCSISAQACTTFGEGASFSAAQVKEAFINNLDALRRLTVLSAASSRPSSQMLMAQINKAYDTLIEDSARRSAGRRC